MIKDLSHSSTSQPGKPLILVVDDSPELLETMTRALFTEGYDCLTATTVAEAIAAFKANHRIALVVLDWRLDLPGSRVIRVVREQNPHLPVLVVSGHPNDPRTDALVDQADAFLQKPFNDTILVSQVKQLLKHSQAVTPTLFPQQIENVLPLEEVKTLYARQVLQLAGNNLSLAASKLKVHRQTLAAIIKQAGGTETATVEADASFQPGSTAGV